MAEIPRISIQEAKKAPKLTLGKISSSMNSRSSISTSQRAGQKRQQRRSPNTSPVLGEVLR
jgi:hypothetical protein